MVANGSPTIVLGGERVIAVFPPILHIHCHSLADANLISHSRSWPPDLVSPRNHANFTSLLLSTDRVMSLKHDLHLIPFLLTILVGFPLHRGKIQAPSQSLEVWHQQRLRPPPDVTFYHVLSQHLPAFTGLLAANMQVKTSLILDICSCLSLKYCFWNIS